MTERSDRQVWRRRGRGALLYFGIVAPRPGDPPQPAVDPSRPEWMSGTFEFAFRAGLVVISVIAFNALGVPGGLDAGLGAVVGLPLGARLIWHVPPSPLTRERKTHWERHHQPPPPDDDASFDEAR